MASQDRIAALQASSAKSYQALVEPLGVKGAVVVEASPWREDNQWVLDLAKDNPVIVALVGHLEPGLPAFGRICGASARTLFRGIRVGGSKVVVDDMRALADADLSLDAIGNAAIVPALLALTDKGPEPARRHQPHARGTVGLASEP